MIVSLRGNQRSLHTRQNLFCLRQRQPQIGDLGKAGGSIDLYQVDTICRDVGACFDQSQNPTHARSPGQKDKDRRIAPGPIPPISGQSLSRRLSRLSATRNRPSSSMRWSTGRSISAGRERRSSPSTTISADPAALSKGGSASSGWWRKWASAMSVWFWASRCPGWRDLAGTGINCWRYARCSAASASPKESGKGPVCAGRQGVPFRPAALDLEAERKALNQHWSQRLERALSVASDMSGLGSAWFVRFLNREITCCRRFGWRVYWMRSSRIVRGD